MVFSQKEIVKAKKRSFYSHVSVFADAYWMTKNCETRAKCESLKLAPLKCQISTLVSVPYAFPQGELSKLIRQRLKQRCLCHGGGINDNSFFLVLTLLTCDCFIALSQELFREGGTYCAVVEKHKYAKDGANKQ